MSGSDRPDGDHLFLLLGELLQSLRADFEPPRWNGPRPSQLRVLGHVPGDGISVSDLADHLRMTAQGCGQLVASLVESGHLQVRSRPEDARVKVVVRTAAGRRAVRRMVERLERRELEWQERTGLRRYRQFHSVLTELAAISQVQ